jgi:hypothetical protein
VVALYQKGEYRGYLAVDAPDGSAIGRSQEGKSRHGIDEASFLLMTNQLFKALIYFGTRGPVIGNRCSEEAPLA